MKTVLITGAGGNLGAACADHFAGKGWQVIAFVSPGAVPPTAKPRMRYVEADLMDEAGTAEVLSRVTGDFPVIDLAVLTVGGFAGGAVEKTDGAALKKMYALNFETAYYTARPLFSHMGKQPHGGRMVFIGARPALDASAGKGLVAYGLSKSLLFKLADYLNAASSTVKTHVIVFSTLDTPQNRTAMPDADRSGWIKPEAVAKTIEEIGSGTIVPTVVEISPK